MGKPPLLGSELSVTERRSTSLLTLSIHSRTLLISVSTRALVRFPLKMLLAPNPFKIGLLTVCRVLEPTRILRIVNRHDYRRVSEILAVSQISFSLCDSHKCIVEAAAVLLTPGCRTRIEEITEPPQLTLAVFELPDALFFAPGLGLEIDNTTLELSHFVSERLQGQQYGAEALQLHRPARLQGQ